LFERGELGHWTSLIYNPIIHVPLIIRRPAQTTREDVHTITSSVDLLPTIAQLTGNPIPTWAEGSLLPKFGGEEKDGRSVFSMDAKSDSAFAPFRNYSMSLTRNRHRLTYYCYPKYYYEQYEFYDLDADPDELKNLYSAQPSLAKAMQAELRQKISEVNKPFQKNGL
jgi:arylsulfatase A-like enzyme